MRYLCLETCGPMTTIQDNGRPGWSSHGIPEGGAMDLPAHRAANLLVGNDVSRATLELGLVGAAFLLHGGPAILAVTGARVDVRVNNDRVGDRTSFAAKPGDRITIGNATAGVFCYLAVDGGLATPVAFASRASDPKSRLGLFEGRPLPPGTALPLGAPSPTARTGLALAPSSCPRSPQVRTLDGPQSHYFSNETVEAFYASPFRVSSASNRMAYRLEGPHLAWRHGDDMISDATLLGSVQIPRDGRPIVLMPDRQTIGGYPKIATVIPEDLHRLAQIPAGGAVRFRRISQNEAVAITVAARRGPISSTILEHAPTPLVDRLHMVSDAAVSAVHDQTWSCRA